MHLGCFISPRPSSFVDLLRETGSSFSVSSRFHKYFNLSLPSVVSHSCGGEKLDWLVVANGREEFFCQNQLLNFSFWKHPRLTKSRKRETTLTPIRHKALFNVVLITISRQMKYSRLEKPFNLKTAEISQFLIGTHLLPLPPFDRNSYPSSPRIYIYLQNTLRMQRAEIHLRPTYKRAWTYRWCWARKKHRSILPAPEDRSRFHRGPGDVEERKLRRGYNVILHFVFRLNIILFSRNRRRAVSSILASPL